MFNYLLIILFLIIITISVLGYGLFFSRLFVTYDNKKINLGYVGFFGFFFLTIISYLTIIIFKHDIFHNSIINIIGLFLFIYFFKKNYLFKDFYILILFFIFFLSSFFLLKNHDDFFYYHFLSSLTLTQDKIQFGLGNLGHGYKQQSSIFFLNSLFFLPYVKYYLFHSVGFLSLIFFNLIFYEQIKKNLNEKKNFNSLFCILLFFYINIKFIRISEYGTDIPGQLILFSIIPLIIDILNFKKVKIYILNIIYFLLTYIITIKTYFISYVFLIIIFLLFSLNKKLNYNLIIFQKKNLIIILTCFLYFFINIAYTGCFIFPVSITCFPEVFFWGTDISVVEYLSNWFQIWAKAGAGPNFRVENIQDYNLGFSWILNWYNRYFLEKGLDNLASITVTCIFFSMCFCKFRKNSQGKKNDPNYKILVLFLTLLIFWFLMHPALRYGGHVVLISFIFLTFSYFVVKNFYIRENNKIIFFTLFIILIVTFNLRNIIRINKEIAQYTPSNFPFYYKPTCEFFTKTKEDDIKIYLPISCPCSIDYTPCMGGDGENIKGKKIFNYNFYNYSH